MPTITYRGIVWKRTIPLSNVKAVKNRNIEIAGIDWSRFNLEEELRGLSDEEKVERMGLIKIIMENSKKLLEIQVTINELKRKKEERERRERREQEREQEETDSWVEECRKKNEKEREE